MAKRFIDTSIFRKDFVRGLDAPHKLLWLYLLSECDHAGLWDKEIEVAETRLGLKFKGDPLANFNEKVIAVNGGKKWFIPSFVEFQYGELNPANRAHASVISLLSKYDLLNEDYKIKPLTSPLQGAMDMVKDMDKAKDKECEKPKIKTTADLAFYLIPETWNGDQFITLWEDYEQIRKSKKKPLTQTAVKLRVGQLVKIAGNDWGKAKASMEKTIAGAWDEFFETKPEKMNGKVFNPDFVRDKA